MTNNSGNPGPKVETLVVDEAYSGQRIDNFLINYLKGVPKSRVYRLLRKGEVRVNKGRIKPDYKLKGGDLVRIPPVNRPATGDYARNRPDTRVLSGLKSSILFEDERLMVLNKPAGLAVHGGSGLDYGAIEAVRQLFPDYRHLELVHRLDRETSGCLIIAKKRSVLRHLHEQFRNNQIKKRYIALVSGYWPDDISKVDAPLLKNTLKSGERLVTVHPDGKSAATLFRPLLRFKQATFMEVELITGRTHQIRVHAAHAGHPLAGDEKYGNRGFNQNMKALGLNRLFLHAKSLSIPMPAKHDGETETIEVVAPLGEELENVLTQLKVQQSSG